MENVMFQCEKTGCTAIIAGRRAHGDLYTFGSGYVMRVSSWSEGTGFEGWEYHAEFDTWYEWWGRNDEVATVLLPAPLRYEYTGIGSF